MTVWAKIAKLWKILAPIIWLLAVLFFIYDYTVNDPKAALVQKALEHEFQTIKPLPAAVLSGSNSSHKPHQSLVGRNYSTFQPYTTIRKYYDTELAAHGWKYIKEDIVRDWGQDYGGKTAKYAKGNYTATLQYAGVKADYGWGYSLDLSWGLDDSLFELRGIAGKIAFYWIMFVFASFAISVLTMSYVQISAANNRGGWRALRKRPFLDTYWRELSKAERIMLWTGIVAFLITGIVSIIGAVISK